MAHAGGSADSFGSTSASSTSASSTSASSTSASSTSASSVAILALDWDMCGWAFDHKDNGREPLIDKLVETVSSSHKAEVLCSSLRQDSALNRVKLRNSPESGCPFVSLPNLAEALAARGCSAIFNPLLMADITNGLPPGTCHQAALEGKDDGNICPRDVTKISLIYSQAHHVVAEIQNEITDNEEAPVDFHFFDDKLDILQCVHMFFDSNKELLPKGLNLHFHNVEHTITDGLTDKDDGLRLDTITGTGSLSKDIAGGVSVLHDAYLLVGGLRGLNPYETERYKSIREVTRNILATASDRKELCRAYLGSVADSFCKNSSQVQRPDAIDSEYDDGSDLTVNNPPAPDVVGFEGCVTGCFAFFSRTPVSRSPTAGNDQKNAK